MIYEIKNINLNKEKELKCTILNNNTYIIINSTIIYINTLMM